MKRLRHLPKSTLIIWLMIATMLLLIMVSIFIRRKDPVVEELPEKQYPVELMTVVLESIEDIVLLPGRMEPSLRARLPTDKPGRVTHIFADRGDSVTNGQVLLRLDNRLWQAMLAAAELELREAEKEYNRWLDLEAAGAVSSSDMDAIRTRLDRAGIQRDEALTHVSQCEVRSPADGIINERFVEVGEHATEGMMVFELVAVDTVKILVDIPERDAVPADGLQNISFTVSVLPGHVFTGMVTFTASAAHPDNNSFRMEVEASNRDRLLKPGMISELRYQRGRLSNAIAIPLEAVIPKRGEHFVYIANDSRAVRRMVRIDRIVGSRAVITEGLAANEQLVVRGNRSLIDGVLLKPVDPLEAADMP